jgi:hypothetical protein
MDVEVVKVGELAVWRADDVLDLVRGVGDHDFALAESLHDLALEPGQHRLALVRLDVDVHVVVRRGVRPEPDEMAVMVQDVGPAVPGPRVRGVEEDVARVAGHTVSLDADLRRRQVRA